MILIRLVFTLALLFALAYAAMFGYMLIREYSIPAPGNTQAMIVLGAQVKSDGQPSKQLELRLETALTEYKKLPRPIVVCGAQGVGEPTTEAAAMRSWLVARDVPADQILLEEDSFNTRQNLEGAVQMLPSNVKDVLIITSDYHLPRAMSIAKDLGLNPSGVGSPILPEFWLKNHAREALAWGKYFVNKFLPFIPVGE